MNLKIIFVPGNLLFVFLFDDVLSFNIQEFCCIKFLVIVFQETIVREFLILFYFLLLYVLSFKPFINMFTLILLTLVEIKE